jgi:hypothetical protein
MRFLKHFKFFLIEIKEFIMTNFWASNILFKMLIKHLIDSSINMESLMNNKSNSLIHIILILWITITKFLEFQRTLLLMILKRHTENYLLNIIQRIILMINLLIINLLRLMKLLMLFLISLEDKTMIILFLDK